MVADKNKKSLDAPDQNGLPVTIVNSLSQISSVKREFILGKMIMIHRFSENCFVVTVI